MGSSATDQLTVHQVTVTFTKDNTPVPPTPAPGTPNPSTTVTLQRTASQVTLDNGYVRVGFDLAHPQIDLIQADFGGRSRYAANLAAAGTGDPQHCLAVRTLARFRGSAGAALTCDVPGIDLRPAPVPATPRTATEPTCRASASTCSRRKRSGSPLDASAA
jgi:hypothetical protein